uniref:HTH La-type RNA-binding domain-containing protein n=1 Tax=Macrostomum lignano TaxID=282301 RepID=A0A1I8H8E2_9PLAT
KSDADSCLLRWAADPERSFRLDGSALRLCLAVTRDRLAKIDKTPATATAAAAAAANEMRKRTNAGKRNLHLARAGQLRRGSSEAEGVPESELVLREQLEKRAREALRNPDVMISPTRLCVHGLPRDLADRDLRRAFQRLGGPGCRIVECRIMRDTTRLDGGDAQLAPGAKVAGRSRGFGFVAYGDHEHAARAVEAARLGPSLPNGRRLVVQFSLERQSALRKKLVRTSASGSTPSAAAVASLTRIPKPDGVQGGIPKAPKRRARDGAAGVGAKQQHQRQRLEARRQQAGRLSRKEFRRKRKEALIREGRLKNEDSGLNSIPKILQLAPRGRKSSLSPAQNPCALASRRHRQRQQQHRRQLETRAASVRAENERLRAKLMSARRELEFLLACWRRQRRNSDEPAPPGLVEAVREASSSCLAASAAAASSDLANKLDELTEQLKRQLEFYLGEGNLLKDRFLRSELDKTEDGYLPLRLFLRFNRVIEFCHRAGVKQRDQILARLRVAIGASRLLALDDDGLRVRRAAPLRQLEPVDERTVYVDGLCGSGASGGSGCKVDRDSVAKMFSTVGQVLYISLPCYRTTGDSKGFAFVEFETSAEAQLAVDRLNSVPRSQWRARLPKFSSQVRSLLRAAEVLKIDTTQLETALYDQGCGGDSGDSVGTSSTSGSASGKRLAVMPKAEWERLRQEMKSARDREIAKLRSRVQKAKSAEANRANVEDAAGGAAGPPAHLRFSAGLIVRLTDADGGLTRKRIRDQLPLGEARDAVAYIDIDEDGRGACLRCRDAAAADRLLALPQLTTPPLSAE